MTPSIRPAARPLSPHPLLEPLEPRTLFSIVLPVSTHVTPVQRPSPVAVSSAAPLFLGTSINALSYQPFTAVLGTIKNLPPLSAIYTLTGQISWGDSTPTSSVTFAPNPDGSLSVLGSHLYTSPGSDNITITLTATPTNGSLAIRLLGTIHSSATILSPNGGRTINPTIHTPFTATLGTFHANTSLSDLSATIDWGDGTTSTGQILALPVTDPSTTSTTPIAGGLFAVEGSHTYSSLGSYDIKVTITSPVFPPTTTTANPTPPIILVFQFDSVADVLPLLATAV